MPGFADSSMGSSTRETLPRDKSASQFPIPTLKRPVTVVAVVQAVSVAAVEAGALASDGAALARSCDAARRQGFA